MSSFPPELIDQIIDNIDQPKDLLSLACCCKSLYLRIIPFHLQWRILHIPLDTIFLPAWEYLASQSSAFIRNIRVLKIMSSHSPDAKLYRLPDCARDTIVDKWTSDPTVSQEDKGRVQEKHGTLMKQLAVDFLGRCEGLEKLIWDHPEPPSEWRLHQLLAGSGSDTTGEVILDDRFSRVLVHCPRLRTVDIIGHIARDSAIFELSHLYEFTYKTFNFATRDTDRTLQRISSMLFRCPNLISLSLEFSSDSSWIGGSEFVTNILFTGRWPNLKRLSLKNPSGGDPRIAGAFFQAHPTLEELSFGNRILYTKINQPPSCHLPHLRRFCGTAFQFLDLLGLHDSTTIRPLENITITATTGSFHYTSIGRNGEIVASPLLESISRLPTIISFTDKMCISAGFPLYPCAQQFSLLTRALPNVQSFYLPRIPLMLMTSQNQADWVEALAHLRRVQVLELIIQAPSGQVEWEKDFVLRVAVACPCLLLFRFGSLSRWGRSDWTVSRDSGKVSLRYGHGSWKGLQ